MSLEVAPVSGDVPLCVACGLCCDGALYSHADLAPGESFPQKHRLRVLGPSQFGLPCPELTPSGCAIYDTRPSPCRAYRCALLLRVEAGELGASDALAKIRRARALVDRIRAALRADQQDVWLLPELGSLLDGTVEVESPETKLDVAELLMRVQRDFGRKRQAP